MKYFRTLVNSIINNSLNHSLIIIHNHLNNDKLQTIFGNKCLTILKVSTALRYDEERIRQAWKISDKTCVWFLVASL